jgi:hypothetical protein
MASQPVVAISRLLPPGAVRPSSAPAPILGGTGLSSPEMRAFRLRLTNIVRAVCELEPHAQPANLITPVMTLALRDRRYLAADDDQWSAFLLYCARTTLLIESELLAVIDQDDRTGYVTIAAVETAKGITRMMREAGAKRIHVGTAFAADPFRCNVGAGSYDFLHEPNLSVTDRGAVVAYYAVCDLPGHDCYSRVLTPHEVAQLRRVSPTRDHRAWVDYPHRMGENAALRSLAAILQEAHPDPRRRGWTLPEPAYRPRPMVTLPDDPYATPAPQPAPQAGCTDADYETDPTRVFADADEATAETLPGSATDFHGWGGQRIGRCPSGILRGVLRWITQKPSRATVYARLEAAITLVLLARRAAVHPEPSTP